MISTKPATLREPVCQCATEAQLREKGASTILKRMGLPAEGSLDRWRHAYVARVLECYGVLAPGAAGLGIEPTPGPLGSALRLWKSEITLAAPAPGAGDIIQVDPNETPRELVNFDFLWSMGVGGQLSSPGTMIAFIESTMNCLRPGGLAVHLLPFDPDGDRLSWPDGKGPFTRNDLERLALTMISRGNQVAQIKIDTASAIRARHPAPSEFEGKMLSQFGVIVRRAPSAL